MFEDCKIPKRYLIGEENQGFTYIMKNFQGERLVAAISSYAILFLLFFSVSFVQYFNGLPQSLVRYGCVSTHSENFFMGLITTADLVYFLSGIFICILLTRLSIENRLWR